MTLTEVDRGIWSLMRDLDSCESSFKLETLSYNTKGFLIWNG